MTKKYCLQVFLRTYPFGLMQAAGNVPVEPVDRLIPRTQPSLKISLIRTSSPWFKSISSLRFFSYWKITVCGLISDWSLRSSDDLPWSINASSGASEVVGVERGKAADVFGVGDDGDLRAIESVREKRELMRMSLTTSSGALTTRRFMNGIVLPV